MKRGCQVSRQLASAGAGRLWMFERIQENWVIKAQRPLQALTLSLHRPLPTAPPPAPPHDPSQRPKHCAYTSDEELYPCPEYLEKSINNLISADQNRIRKQMLCRWISDTQVFRRRCFAEGWDKTNRRIRKSLRVEKTKVSGK